MLRWYNGITFVQDAAPAPWTCFAMLYSLALLAQLVPTTARDLPKYAITVALDLKATRIQVDARVTLPPTSQPRSSVSFALSELFPDAKITLLTGGRPLDSVRTEKTNRPYSRPGWGTNTWRLTPVRPIPAGQPVTLRVSYSGSGDLKSFVFSLGERVAFASGINTAWYPAIEEAEPHPAGRLRALRGTGEVTFEVDSGVVVYMAAQPVGRNPLRFRAAQPMYFAFAAGPYIATNGMYYLSARATARSDGDRATAVLRALESEFGRHPFGRFAVVEVPTGDAERAGFAGASADGLIMASTEFVSQPFNTAYYGHEIAHQWWGVTVRPTGQRGSWMLSEAMAQFGSLRAVEAMEGAAAAEQYRRDEYPGYIGQGGKLYFRTVAEGHDTALADLPADAEWSRALANSKGFMAWNALSLEVGRPAFRRILSDVAARFATSRITWDQFLAEVTRGAQRDLSWFYSQWFDRPGAPDWQIETVDSAGIRRWTIRQRSVPWRLSVRVDMTSERCGRRTMRIVLREAVTLLPPPVSRCGVESVIVDPSYEILHWTAELRKEFSKP